MRIRDGASLRRALRRRRDVVLLVLLVLALALRIALPEIVRRVAVSEVDAALVGRIALEDVDLSLLRGGVTLHGLEVRTDELPPPLERAKPTEAGSAPAPAPPMVRVGRLWVRIGWLGLFARTLVIREVELEDFALHLERAHDGTLVAPRPVAATEEPPPAPRKEGAAWGLVVRDVRLKKGRIAFFDFAVSERPEPLELSIDDVVAQNLALQITAEGETAGHVHLDARIEDGSLSLDTQVAMTPQGPATESHIEASGLPIHRSRLYLARLGWSEIEGRLDARIEHTFEQGGAHRAAGTVTLHDLAVRVEGREEPVLGWKRLVVELGDVDLVARHVEVARVEHQGLHVLLAPREPVPLPLFAHLALEAAAAERAEQAAAAPPLSDERPWTWRLTQARVVEAQATVLGGPEPLLLGVEAEVHDLASDPGTESSVRAELRPPGGSLGVEGRFTLEPPSFDGSLHVADLALPALLAPLEAPAASLLARGVVSADLAIAAGAPAGGPDAATVRVSGKLGLADLALVDPASRDFSLAWKSCDLAVREIVAPGVLQAAAGARLGTMQVALDRFRLEKPVIHLTRAPAGIVLPAALGAAAPAGAPRATAPVTGAKPAAAPAAKPPEAPTADAQPRVAVQVARLTIARGRVEVEDRGVTPFYRAEIEPLDLDATDVRWPGPTVSRLRLDARTKDGGTLHVTGSLGAKLTKVETRLDDLPLAPFNPYATASGYGVREGAASLTSSFQARGERYDATNRIVVSGLEVTGDQSESLFQRQFGIPLSLALALLTDLEGNISLDVPISGDRKGTRVALGSIISQTLAKAIMGAITSPLKMISAVAGLGEAAPSATPQAIAFRPGRAELAEGEGARVAQLAALLGRSPALRLELRGVAGAEDARWLREQALRAEIERTSGVVGSVRYVRERTERKVALELLQKRAADQAAEVPAEVQPWFERQVGQQALAPGQLEKLAAERAAAVQATLTREHGVAPERVGLDPPSASDTGADHPSVALRLGSTARVAR